MQKFTAEELLLQRVTLSELQFHTIEQKYGLTTRFQSRRMILTQTHNRIAGCSVIALRITSARLCEHLLSLLLRVGLVTTA